MEKGQIDGNCKKEDGTGEFLGEESKGSKLLETNDSTKANNPFLFELNKPNDKKLDGDKLNFTSNNMNANGNSNKVYVLQRVNLENIMKNSRKDYINRLIAKNRKITLLSQNENGLIAQNTTP